VKAGDLVRNKTSASRELGLFIGLKIFDSKYECAEVMWFKTRASNGDVVSTIQKDLIEVISQGDIL
jgi:hypothetical protein